MPSDWWGGLPAVASRWPCSPGAVSLRAVTAVFSGTGWPRRYVLDVKHDLVSSGYCDTTCKALTEQCLYRSLLVSSHFEFASAEIYDPVWRSRPLIRPSSLYSKLNTIAGHGDPLYVRNILENVMCMQHSGQPCLISSQMSGLSSGVQIGLHRWIQV